MYPSTEPQTQAFYILPGAFYYIFQHNKARWLIHMTAFKNDCLLLFVFKIALDFSTNLLTEYNAQFKIFNFVLVST